jgi:hypothetical protein
MRPARISASAPGTSVKGGSKVRVFSGIVSSILADGRYKQQNRFPKMCADSGLPVLQLQRAVG